MLWCAHKVRDIARGYSDADIESMQLKLDSGNKKFTDREHTAYVCEVQQAPQVCQHPDYGGHGNGRT
jgi:hypothetical protein